MTSKEIIKQIIVKLEDELQHYTMVDIDRVKAKYIEFEIKDYKQVLKDLERLEVLETSVLEYKDQEKLYWQTAQNNASLRDENAKLKKVIEIIKTLPNCDICDENWYKGCMCLQRKIKEVMNNENHSE